MSRRTRTEGLEGGMPAPSSCQERRYGASATNGLSQGIWGGALPVPSCGPLSCALGGARCPPPDPSIFLPNPCRAPERAEKGHSSYRWGSLCLLFTAWDMTGAAQGYLEAAGPASSFPRFQQAAFQALRKRERGPEGSRSPVLCMLDVPCRLLVISGGGWL